MRVEYDVSVNNPLLLPGLTDITNVAYASSVEEPVEISATREDPLNVIDVSLDKQINDDTPLVNDTVTFTLRVSNAVGSQTATNLTVTDIVPDGYTYVVGSIFGGDTKNEA